MLRTTAIARVERNLDVYPVAHHSFGGFADSPVQVEIEAPVANGHHVHAPCLSGQAVNA